MMLNKTYQKLKSTNGASLVLVMVLFLLCVMVSSVIVAAASSGAARNANRVTKQKGYLAVTSAVGLIKKEMENAGSYVGEYTLEDYACNSTGTKKLGTIEGKESVSIIEEDTQVGRDWYDGTPKCVDVLVESVADREEGASSTLGGAFEELLREACMEICVNGATGFETDFTIEAEDARVPDVNCNFKMDTAYNITMVLSVEDGSSSYAVTMGYTADVDEIDEEEASSEDLSCKHTIKYKERRPDGSLSGYKAKTDYEFIGATQTISTTVSWPNAPAITKGIN